MIHRGLRGESRRRNILSELCSSAAAAGKEKKKQTLLPYLHFISLRWAANWALHVEKIKKKKENPWNKESELKRKRRYRWHNPMSGSVNFACESRECSAGRRHGGKSLKSLHRPCLVVQSSDHELVLDPVGRKKTHIIKGKGGENHAGWWEGVVFIASRLMLQQKKPRERTTTNHDYPSHHFSVWAHLSRNCYDRQINE